MNIVSIFSVCIYTFIFFWNIINFFLIENYVDWIKKEYINWRKAVPSPWEGILIITKTVISLGAKNLIGSEIDLN